MTASVVVNSEAAPSPARSISTPAGMPTSSTVSRSMVRISVALYNTAFGLIVAIPSLMFYRYFRTRVDYFQLTMELAAERLVPHLMRFAVRGGPKA